MPIIKNQNNLFKEVVNSSLISGKVTYTLFLGWLVKAGYLKYSTGDNIVCKAIYNWIKEKKKLCSEKDTISKRSKTKVINKELYPGKFVSSLFFFSSV